MKNYKGTIEIYNVYSYVEQAEICLSIVSGGLSKVLRLRSQYFSPNMHEMSISASFL